MKKFILISLFNILFSTYDSFRSECGPYLGLEDEIMMPEKQDCFADTYLGQTKKCCFVEGEKYLSRKTTCVLIRDTPEEKLGVIQDLSNIATNLKIECFTPKKYNSDCNVLVSEPTDEFDCLDISNDKENEKCCLVKISSQDFNGNICKRIKTDNLNELKRYIFDKSDSYTKFEVKCFDCLININYFTFILFLFYFILI